MRIGPLIAQGRLFKLEVSSGRFGDFGNACTLRFADGSEPMRLFFAHPGAMGRVAAKEGLELIDMVNHVDYFSSVRAHIYSIVMMCFSFLFYLDYVALLKVYVYMYTFILYVM